MKKFTLTFILFLFAIAMLAQVPSGFSYQAVVRNTSGEVVAGKTVKFKFSILQNSQTGTPVYVETQSKATNDFGLANLVVGAGTRVSGNFDPSAWGSHSHFLKVELDPNNGNTFSHLGTMQLMAVPYAFHAKTVEELADNSVTSAKITSGAVTGGKIAQGGATSGQTLKWNGTTWAPAIDNVGSWESPWQTTGDNVFRNKGKVGIGTNVPAAQLHVQGTAAGQGNVVFVGEVKTLNPDDPPVSGEGARLMWYPDKPAFRAGYVANNQWDKDNVGSGSVAMGVSPTASGIISTAFGFMTIASGGYSTALGQFTKASGQSSIAIGNHTVASGNNSTSIGLGTEAFSYCEIAIGAQNTIYTPANKTGWNDNDRLFVIGRNRVASNAITVLKNGRTGIGIDIPQAGLHVQGYRFPDSFMFIEASVGNDAGIRLYDGETAKWHIFNNVASGGLQIYNTEGNTAIFAKQTNSFVGLGTTNPTQKLHVVGNAYKTEGGTSWATSSDLRLKTVLGDYEKGLNEITALQPVTVPIP
jgi:hypothetical protein